MRKSPFSILLILSIFGVISLSCSGKNNSNNKNQINSVDTMTQLDTITLGAGCFWCVEAVYQDLKGVHSVVSGYMGGKIKNPSYKEVCTGLTGHAEVCQIAYDPQIISFDEILEVFWQTHDPTTLNRQGADIGTQYRSVIFYHNDHQKLLSEQWKEKLNKEQVFPNPIVTNIEPAQDFYPAEDYHQNYFNENGSQPYCAIVIKPKLDKFKKAFKDKLK